MASFRNTREALVLAYDQNLIDTDEFCLLYDINTSRNLDYPYWNYNAFELDNLSDAECKAEFRFLRSDVYRLAEVLGIPDEITTYNRSKFNGLEAFCVFLKRFAYPSRYGDLVKTFGRPVPELCMMSTKILDIVHDDHSHLLHDFNQAWLAQNKLEEFAAAIYDKGAALDNCWGFIDGTLRPCCRPGQYQRYLYNGHKRVHGIKFQSVIAPNGLIADLFGPVEGRRHDSGMLAISNLLPRLQAHSHRVNGGPLCIYGDPAYPLRVHLQAPFRGNNITPLQHDFNTRMSQVRVTVEWMFGQIATYFAFLDFNTGGDTGGARGAMAPPLFVEQKF